MGMLPVGFLRTLSVGLQLYIDDSPVLGLRGESSLRSVRQAVYVIVIMKSEYFGYHMSRKKCALWEPIGTTFLALGLLCDRAVEAFRVPAEKRAKFCAMGRALVTELRDSGRYVPMELARFTGLAMFLSLSILGTRMRLNSLYHELAGMPLASECGRARVQRQGWWRSFPTGLKRARGEVVAGMIEDIEVLMLRVREDRVVLWRRPGKGALVEVSVDSTRWQFGFTVRKVSKDAEDPVLDGRSVGAVLMTEGGTFATRVAGMDLATLNTG